MATLEKRPVLRPGEHPIETKRYVLPTKAVEAMINVLYQWISHRLPGGIVCGRPQLGKTRAITFFCRQITSLFGKSLPTFVVECKPLHNSRSESAFLSFLLQGCGSPFADKGNTLVKEQRLINLLEESAKQARDRRVLLILDEAQWLYELQYRWLMDIYNVLDARDIDLFVVFVGQDELRHQRSAFVDSGQRQILGRFMANMHEFHGLRSVADVRAALTCYDTGSEYPKDSGWSYTRYFLPQAFASGWRLANHANTYWEATRALHADAELGRLKEIPMRVFSGSIDMLLTRLAKHDGAETTLGVDDIQRALKAVSYIDLQRYSPPTDRQ